jgi:hypothetical protein
MPVHEEQPGRGVAGAVTLGAQLPHHVFRPLEGLRLLREDRRPLDEKKPVAASG